MSASPKFAHVVFRTGQAKEMRDWYCDLLDAHVVYEDEALTFMTYDDEHHRVALLHPPVADRSGQTRRTPRRRTMSPSRSRPSTTSSTGSRS